MEPMTGNAKQRLRQFTLFLAGLALLFGQPLFDWVKVALTTELNSHVILIPLVSAYLGWQVRKQLPSVSVASPALAAIPAAIGVALLTAPHWLASRGVDLTKLDVLALRMGSLWCFALGGGLFFLGGAFLRPLAFPIGFLLFFVPLSDLASDRLEVFLQHASADVAAAMFSLSGETYFRDELIFRLPGVSIRVAQECSGVRSTYALFITSFVAGYMFLQSGWGRTILTLVVFPLGLIRNGFRIWTLAVLASKWDTRVLDSPLHHHGGPLFFAIFLVPFFLIMWWIRKVEMRANRSRGAVSQAAGQVDAPEKQA